MFYKLEKTESGYSNVVSKSGEKLLLVECGMAQSKAGTNVGYTEFPSRESCLAAWGLTEVPEEELFPQEEGDE